MKKIVLFVVLSLFAFVNTTVAAPAVDGVSYSAAKYSADFPATIVADVATMPERLYAATGEITQTVKRISMAFKIVTAHRAAWQDGAYEVGWQRSYYA